METSPHQHESSEKITEHLLNYAIDRDDVKYLLARLPSETRLKPVQVAYELQILKIISIGWGLAYYLHDNSKKGSIEEQFWQAVKEFSAQLSETTGLIIGQDINYFQVLRDRLAHYVSLMAEDPHVTDPVQVIGPAFADLCGDRDDPFARLTGAKLFNEALFQIRQYLQALKLR
jgi:hypothetical protein